MCFIGPLDNEYLPGEDHPEIYHMCFRVRNKENPSAWNEIFIHSALEVIVHYACCAAAAQSH